MSQDAIPPTVNVHVPLSNIEGVFEALSKAGRPDLRDGHEHEDFFAKQNPATKELAKIARTAYDDMAKSLVKEITEVLK